MDNVQKHNITCVSLHYSEDVYLCTVKRVNLTTSVIRTLLIPGSTIAEVANSYLIPHAEPS
jgi:hypothetical protein